MTFTGTTSSSVTSNLFSSGALYCSDTTTNTSGITAYRPTHMYCQSNLKEEVEKIVKNMEESKMEIKIDAERVRASIRTGEKAPTIKKVETFNGKAVKVTFSDDTFEKAVCSDLDSFSVDVGITICVLKKMLGEDGHKRYNKMMRGVHKLMQKQVIDEIKERERIEREKRKAEKAREKAMRRKEKAREDYIDAHVEALMRFNAKKQA